MYVSSFCKSMRIIVFLFSQHKGGKRMAEVEEISLLGLI